MSRWRALILLAVALIASLAGPAPASTGQEPPASTDGCVKWDIAGQCIKVVPIPVGVPQQPAPGAGEDGPRGPGAPLPDCRWRTIPTMPGIEAWIGPPPAEMQNPVLQGYQCDSNEGVPDAAIGLPVAFRWVEGGPAAPAPMTPAALAQVLYVRVRAQMQAPRVAADPPPASPAVVNVPVFVEVANWQPPIVDTECDPLSGLCVSMTATPSLAWEPGEQGASVLRCDPPGSRFDPVGGPAEVQAAEPGACAWTYKQRTGVEGRPDSWAGSVTVSWSVVWLATDGTNGFFPDLSFTAAAPRAVDEVQTVVADSE